MGEVPSAYRQLADEIRDSQQAVGDRSSPRPFEFTGPRIVGVYAFIGPAVGAALVLPLSVGMVMLPEAGAGLDIARGVVELPRIFVTALLAGYVGGLIPALVTGFFASLLLLARMPTWLSAFLLAVIGAFSSVALSPLGFVGLAAQSEGEPLRAGPWLAAVAMIAALASATLAVLIKRKMAADRRAKRAADEPASP